MGVEEHLKNKFGFPYDLTKDIIKEIDLYKSKNLVCQVCLNKLTREEAQKISDRDFLICCDKHLKFKGYFNLHIAKKEAQII